VNKSDPPAGPIERKDDITDIPILYCARCGQPFGKMEIPKECKTCHLKYHYYCGFPTPASEICKYCIYEEHKKEYARIQKEDNKKALFGWYLTGVLFLLVLCTAFYGFDYFGGASSSLIPFIIFCILTIATIVVILKNIPILRE
jgi:hypothetical protein